ncbi:hypothetical protein ACIP2Z_18290 [Streptomyces iakyrus]|uniref:Transposase n=1 Tax=Streptomyces iakyrus TaxID=68219 RepID=A0ABW8FFS2_9ACTN
MVTALHEGLATVPDRIISAHDSAQQFLGLTPRTTGRRFTQIGLWPIRPQRRRAKERT